MGGGAKNGCDGGTKYFLFMKQFLFLPHFCIYWNLPNWQLMFCLVVLETESKHIKEGLLLPALPKWNKRMYFLHIGYHDPVPWATDVCKTEFSPVPNLSHYGHFVITSECLLWYIREEYNDFVHIWYSYQEPCVSHAYKIPLGSVQNWSNYDHFCVHVLYVLWYLRKELVDFIHIWYSNQVRCVVKYHLALCKIIAFKPIFFLHFMCFLQ